MRIGFGRGWPHAWNDIMLIQIYRQLVMRINENWENMSRCCEMEITRRYGISFSSEQIVWWIAIVINMEKLIKRMKSFWKVR